MAGFWGKRKREQEELQTQDDDLARRAEQAIVAADERIRTAADELGLRDRGARRRDDRGLPRGARGRARRTWARRSSCTS